MQTLLLFSFQWAANEHKGLNPTCLKLQYMVKSSDLRFSWQ